MKTVFLWMKKEMVLVAAWVLAVCTAFFIPPDLAYLNYIDYHTLGLLLCLMAVMAGLQGLGIFQKLGESLLKRVKTTRQLEGILVFLCFFSSMLITNDVALITFVPFSITVFKMARLKNRDLPVVAFQTIADGRQRIFLMPGPLYGNCFCRVNGLFAGEKEFPCFSPCI